MEARVKLSAPAVPVGQVIDVLAVGEDGRPAHVLGSLGNGDGFVMPVGREGKDLPVVLRVRGLTDRIA